jgi:hypothetical protein
MIKILHSYFFFGNNEKANHTTSFGKRFGLKANSLIKVLLLCICRSGAYIEDKEKIVLDLLFENHHC